MRERGARGALLKSIAGLVTAKGQLFVATADNDTGALTPPSGTGMRSPAINASSNVWSYPANLDAQIDAVAVAKISGDLPLSQTSGDLAVSRVSGDLPIDQTERRPANVTAYRPPSQRRAWTVKAFGPARKPSTTRSRRQTPIRSTCRRYDAPC